MNKDRVVLENACAEFEADLVLYYYGEGSATERRRVETHIEACKCCGRFLDDLRGLLPQMSEKPDLPQTFWDNYYREMVHKLDREREKKPWWRHWIPSFGGWALPAFGTLAVAAVAVGLLFSKGEWNLSTKATQQEAIPQEILTDASRLEFFNSMDLLESLPVLEKMDGSRGDSADVQRL